MHFRHFFFGKNKLYNFGKITYETIKSYLLDDNERHKSIT